LLSIWFSGVCEPLGSDQCKGKNQIIACSGSGGFDCPPIHGSGKCVITRNQRLAQTEI